VLKVRSAVIVTYECPLINQLAINIENKSNVGITTEHWSRGNCRNVVYTKYVREWAMPKIIAMHCTAVFSGSRDKSVYWLGYGLPDRVSIPGRAGIFRFVITSEPAVGPTQPPIQWTPEISFLGCKTDDSHLSVSEVKNAWSYTSTPTYIFMTW
jgi:hypothetical protein